MRYPVFTNTVFHRHLRRAAFNGRAASVVITSPTPFVKTGYRIVSLLLAAFAWIGVAAGQNPAKSPVVDQALTHLVDQVLKDVSSIQPGMTRAELLHVFTTEGGLSTRNERQYVYRRCPYIKVIVSFRRPNDADDNWDGAPEEEWTGDIIQSMSKPFLEYSIAD
jgi:hypothetical protein